MRSRVANMIRPRIGNAHQGVVCRHLRVVAVHGALGHSIELLSLHNIIRMSLHEGCRDRCNRWCPSRVVTWRGIVDPSFRARRRKEYLASRKYKHAPILASGVVGSKYRIYGCGYSRQPTVSIVIGEWRVRPRRRPTFAGQCAARRRFFGRWLTRNSIWSARMLRLDRIRCSTQLGR